MCRRPRHAAMYVTSHLLSFARLRTRKIFFSPFCFFSLLSLDPLYVLQAEAHFAQPPCLPFIQRQPASQSANKIAVVLRPLFTPAPTPGYMDIGVDGRSPVCHVCGEGTKKICIFSGFPRVFFSGGFFPGFFSIPFHLLLQRRGVWTCPARYIGTLRERSLMTVGGDNGV